MDQFGHNSFNTDGYGNPVNEPVNTTGYANPVNTAGYVNPVNDHGNANGYGGPVTERGMTYGYGNPVQGQNPQERPYMNVDTNRAPRLPVFNEPMSRQGEVALLECRNLTKRYMSNRPAALEDINI